MYFTFCFGRIHQVQAALITFGAKLKAIKAEAEDISQKLKTTSESANKEAQSLREALIEANERRDSIINL